MAGVQNITLSVPDISCTHCVKAINTVLSALPGVENIDTDLQAKTVHLHYAPNQVTLQQIEAALEEIGYMVAK